MLSAGTLLSHYEVLSLAGSGGMGEVYLARNVRLGRKFALKLLTVSCSRDGDLLHRIDRAARAAESGGPYVRRLRQPCRYSRR